jgi:hypothetical protein
MITRLKSKFGSAVWGNATITADKKQQYRYFAAASLAKHAPDERDKARLLAMAEAWLELAERKSPIAEFRTRWLDDD